MSVIDQDVLRVTVNFELADGSNYQNIYHLIRDGTDPYSDAAHITAINTWITACYNKLVTLVRNDITKQLCFVDRVAWNEITDAWEVVENTGTFTPTWAPSGTGDTLPYMSSPFVVFKTQRPKSVGKKFLFPVTELQQADTVLITGAVTAITNYAADVITAIALGGDATLSAVIVRTGVQSVLPLLVAVVTDVLGSQKRRRPGVGG